MFEFILSTGIRRGEAVGLRWPNVDLERGTVRIPESVTTVASKAQYTATKTSSSKRTLPLCSEALALLQRVRDKSNEERDIHGVRYTPSDAMFTGLLGAPLGRAQAVHGASLRTGGGPQAHPARVTPYLTPVRVKQPVKPGEK